MLTYTKISSSCSVNDLGAAKAFYGKVLGLSVTESPEGLSVAVARDYDLFLYPKPNHAPATYTGPLAAWFADPAGNILGLMQPRKN